jgi:hypothetical protein
MNPVVLHDFLRRLMPHVDSARVALTGGVAIGVHGRRANGIHPRLAAADDVDFVAEGVEAVRESVTKTFLVSHFHLPQPAHPKFLVQLAEPATRLRVDFFPDALGALSRASVVEIGGIPLRVLDMCDVLEHKLHLISGASAHTPVEPKHYADARALGVICGRTVPRVDPSHLVRIARSESLDEICPRCQTSRSPAFPLASKRALFDVLGYV